VLVSQKYEGKGNAMMRAKVMERGYLLDNCRRNNLARTTPGCETIKNDDFVFCDCGFEGLATVCRISIYPVTPPIYPFNPIPSSSSISNRPAPAIYHLRSRKIATKHRQDRKEESDLLTSSNCEHPSLLYFD
jgi:hypothetical protein